MGRRIKRTLPAGQVETYRYDLAGNLVSKTDFNGYTTSYQYDSMNRLVAKIPDPRRGEQPVTFAYNELGLRTNMLDASGVTQYRYDVRGRLEQKLKTWTAVGLTVALNYTYDACGTLITQTGDTPNNYLYCGEQFDSDLGLYFLRARYLNPDTSRFWRMDSHEGFVSDPASLHKYLFAHANPVVFVDPSGQFSLGELMYAPIKISTIAGVGKGQQNVRNVRRALQRNKIAIIYLAR